MIIEGRQIIVMKMKMEEEEEEERNFNVTLRRGRKERLIQKKYKAKINKNK